MSIFLEPAMPDVLKCKVTYLKLDSSDILPELYMFVFLIVWLQLKTTKRMDTKKETYAIVSTI